MAVGVFVSFEDRDVSFAKGFSAAVLGVAAGLEILILTTGAGSGTF